MTDDPRTPSPGDSTRSPSPLSGREQTRELAAAIQRLSLARSLPTIQEIVRTYARRLTGADAATLVLRDGTHCLYADEDAISPLWRNRRFPLDDCVSGWVMTNGRALAIEDIYADDRVPHEAYRRTFVKSLAMVPIRAIDPVGAIGNYWSTSHLATEDELGVLQALADSAAVAMENIRVYEELDAARLEILQRLALVAEYRDDATHDHTERVALTATLIGTPLGLNLRAISLLRQAAPLHDIGKIAVSDALLRKPGALTPAEFEQVKRHATDGAAILAGSSSAVLRTAEEIARSHHEWWDGSGYPNGISGEEIPLTGRILALADVFDALTHERPYKPAWSVDAATEEIRRLAGRQFDPDVVAAFEELDPLELANPSGLRATA